jgi:geranylgeranyl pyrophosphate synthase
MTSIADALSSYKNRVEEKLKTYLPMDSKNELDQAMVYATLNGGKRIRPALIYLVGKALNANLDALDIPACAIEILHSFSLVHDDLPALDNDDLRRGKPTCHKAFDEATAILTGDALLILSFDILSQNTPLLNSMQQVQLINILSKSSGALGMTRGQALDTKNNASLTLDALTQIHQLKTSALLEASVKMACIVAHCNDNKIMGALNQYARYIGLNFQIRDDIIDIESTTEVLGKTAGSDKQQNKPTFPKLLGLEKAKKECVVLNELAVEQLKKIGLEKSLLADLSHYIIDRKC